METLLSVLFGLALFLAGYYLANKYKEIKVNGIKTEGKIVSYEEDTGMDTDGYSTTYYYPIIEFINKGKIVTQKYSTGTSLKPKKILPTKVELYYFLDKKKGEYDLFLPNNLVSKYAPVVLIVIGLIVVVCSSLVFLFNINISDLLTN